MNSIKLLFIGMLFYGSSNAQQISTETDKQETMAWIASKLEKHLTKKTILEDDEYTLREFESYQDGQFSFLIFDYRDNGRKVKFCGKRRCTIDLNRIKGYSFKYDDFFIQMDEGVVKYQTLEDCHEYAVQFRYGGGFKITSTNNQEAFAINLEEGLGVLMEEKFKQLIKLNLSSK